jgi:hypothetical protein
VGAAPGANQSPLGEFVPGETLIVYAPEKALAAKAPTKAAEANGLEPLPALPTENALSAASVEEAAATTEEAGER